MLICIDDDDNYELKTIFDIVLSLDPETKDGPSISMYVFNEMTTLNILCTKQKRSMINQYT